MTKIQVGDVWETADGAKVFIKLVDHELSNIYPIYGDNGLSYTKSGELWYNERTNQDLVKLISRVEEIASTEQNNKTPHKHAELIKAWADGAEIQTLHGGNWKDCDPQWFHNAEYRIKPEPPVSRWLNVYFGDASNLWHDARRHADYCATKIPHVRRIAVIEDKQDGTPWVLHQL